MRHKESDILQSSLSKKSRNTVRRHYLKWRANEGISERCDNPECIFYTAPLSWNNQVLTPILDHISGNSYDNSTNNLRLLCPNCDSQNKDTRGGANVGRIEKLSGSSYHVRHRDGRQDAHAFGTLTNISITPTNGSAIKPNNT